MMPQITPKAFFALKPDVKQCAHYITDFQILYPAGSVLILHNYYEKRQRYINLHEKSVFLEMICMSPSRKLAALIQNRTKEKGQIVIFDLQTLKKKRTLNLPPDSVTNRFETLSFTYDDKYIVAITGEPDWNLVLYNWIKGKLTSCSKAITSSNPATVVQICCSPTNNAEICLVGQGLFRLLSRTETVWKQYGFQKGEQINITTAAWLTSERILCGTADGKLFLVENGDLRAVYSAPNVNVIHLKERDDTSVVGSSSLLLFKSMSEAPGGDDVAVRALIAFPKGFAFSFSSGSVYLFEKEGPHKYKKRNVFRVSDSDLSHLPQFELNIVRHMSINVSQDKLLAATGRAQLYSVHLWGPDINVAPEIPFKILGEPLHHGPISDLTMCMWKPIFVTSGVLDRTVRLWNYETETVQIVKHFPEDIFCVDLHPTGNFLAIGFAGRVEYSIVLMNDIQSLRSLPVTESSLCKFSFCGHYLAIVTRGLIEIYGTVLIKNVFTLKGHLGSVNALQWISDDKKIVTCSSEGEIFIWNMINGNLITEIRAPEEVGFVDIAISQDGIDLYAVDTEGVFQRINNGNVFRLFKFGNLKLEKIFTSLANSVMFMTGGYSGIVCVKLPLSDPPEFSEYHYHASRITQLKLSADDQTLVSISTAGTVIIWKLNVWEGRTVQMDKNLVHASEILINKLELEKKIFTMKELSQKLYELEMDQAREMRDTESSFCEKIKEIHETYLHQIDELKEKILNTESDQEKQLADVKKEIDQLRERQEKEKADLVENYTSKLSVEYEKVRALDALKEETITNFRNRIDDLEKSREEETNELIRIFDQKLADVNNLLLQTYEEHKKNIREHELEKQQVDEDTDRELVETRAKYEGLLKEEKEQNESLREEAAIMRKSYAEAQKERNEVGERLEELQEDLAKHQMNIHKLEKEVADLKVEIVERDATLDDKDETIFSLKHKIQEMDKFKFVLDYKAKELQKEIDPKDREIREKKEQIEDMEIEQANLKKINSSLELQASELREKIRGTEKEISIYERKHLLGSNLMRQIRVDIYSLYQELDDFKKLKDGIKDLFHKYRDCSITFRPEQYGESDVQRELLSQREFLERTIKALKSTLQKSKTTKSNTTKVLQDNVVLIEELNVIRKDLKEAVHSVQNLEALITGSGKKAVIPSEAYNKLQQVLNKQEAIKMWYKSVIDGAESEMKEYEVKVESMQNDLTVLKKASQ